MEPLTIGLMLIGLLLVLILLGVHIGVALMTMSIVGVWWITGDISSAGNLVGTGVFYCLWSYVLAVVPLFSMMGLLANLSGASADLFDAAALWLRRVPGSLAIATVFANAVFAAVTGVSVASAAVFSKISLPQMQRLGYSTRLATGCVAGSSALGMLIPPSVLLILYGLLARESIGAMFIAGIIPGVILSALFCILIFTMVSLRPSFVAGVSATVSVSWGEQLRSLVNTWGVVAIILVTLGGIYAGFFTATEAGAVGAIAALILAAAKRRLSVSGLWATLLETGRMCASFFLLYIGAQMFSRMLAVSGVSQYISATAAAMPVPPVVMIVMFIAIYLFLGMFLDVVSQMVLTLPLMIPVVHALGFDPIWFGIIAVVSAEMGLITPPFGMAVFVIKAAVGEGASLEDIFIGSFPFLIMMMVLLAILITFPILVTWLPSQM